MRLVFLTHALPTPTDGGLLAPYHLALRLAARHRVAVVTVRRPEDRAEDRDRLAGAGVELVQVEPDPEGGTPGRLRRFLSPLPGIVGLHDHSRLGPAAAALGADAAVGFTCNMAPALARLAVRTRVLVAFDAESRLASRAGVARPGLLGGLLTRLHAWKYARLERVYYPRFTAVVVVGRRDREWLAEAVPAARFVLVPNGVDRDYFAAAVEPVRPDPVPAGPAATLFGTLNVPSTVDAALWYAREVHPKVRAQVPGSELWLVGRAPTPAVRALADLPGVRVTGPVPDVRPWLAAARVALAPFRFGGGMKQKVLEALAAGLPVVSTPEGVAGFDGGLAASIAIAAEPDAFAARVAERLRAPRDPAAVRAEAGPAMLARHSWEACAAAYEGLLAGEGR